MYHLASTKPFGQTLIMSFAETIFGALQNLALFEETNKK